MNLELGATKARLRVEFCAFDDPGARLARADCRGIADPDVTKGR
jgi:hypothetical protein